MGRGGGKRGAPARATGAESVPLRAHDATSLAAVESLASSAQALHSNRLRDPVLALVDSLRRRFDSDAAGVSAQKAAIEGLRAPLSAAAREGGDELQPPVLGVCGALCDLYFAPRQQTWARKAILQALLGANGAVASGTPGLVPSASRSLVARIHVHRETPDDLAQVGAALSHLLDSGGAWGLAVAGACVVDAVSLYASLLRDGAWLARSHGNATEALKGCVRVLQKLSVPVSRALLQSTASRDDASRATALAVCDAAASSLGMLCGATDEDAAGVGTLLLAGLCVGTCLSMLEPSHALPSALARLLLPAAPCDVSAVWEVLSAPVANIRVQPHNNLGKCSTEWRGLLSLSHVPALALIRGVLSSVPLQSLASATFSHWRSALAPLAGAEKDAAARVLDALARMEPPSALVHVLMAVPVCLLSHANVVVAGLATKTVCAWLDALSRNAPNTDADVAVGGGSVGADRMEPDVVGVAAESAVVPLSSMREEGVPARTDAAWLPAVSLASSEPFASLCFAHARAHWDSPDDHLQAASRDLYVQSLDAVGSVAGGAFAEACAARLLSLHPRVRVRYRMLAPTLKHVTSVRILDMCPSLPSELLAALASNLLTAPATEAYDALLRRTGCDAAASTQWWMERFWPLLANALRLPSSTSDGEDEDEAEARATVRKTLTSTWLPRTLSALPGVAGPLLDIAREGTASRDEDGLRVSVAILRAVRSAGLLSAGAGAVAGDGHPFGPIAVDSLVAAAESADDALRLDAAALAAVHPRRSEGLSEAECRVLAAFVAANGNSPSTYFRQQMMATLRVAVLRVRDAVAAIDRDSRQAAKRKAAVGADPIAAAGTTTESTLESEEGARTAARARMVAFSRWLRDVACAFLYPGGSFQRRAVGLRLVSLLFEAFGPESGGCLAEMGGEGAQQLTVSGALCVSLLGCIDTTFEEVSSMSRGLLVTHVLACARADPASALAGSSLSDPTPFVRFAWPLLSAVRAADTLSGSNWLQFAFEVWPMGLDAHVCACAGNACACPADAALCLLSSLVDGIEAQLATARGDLVCAARSQPMHGFLLAARKCLEAAADFHSRTRVGDAALPLWRLLLGRAAGVARECMSFVLGVLSGGSASIPDFADIEVSLGEAVATSAGTDAGSGNDERDRMYSCLWLTLRESSELIASTVALFPLEPPAQAHATTTTTTRDARQGSTAVTNAAEASPQGQDGPVHARKRQKHESAEPASSAPEGTSRWLVSLSSIAECGAAFLSLLTSCRHRGAIETGAAAFARVCRRLLGPAEGGRYEAVCGGWLEHALAHLESAASITRRGAGIPLSVQAVLGGDASQGRRLARPCIARLVATASAPVAHGADPNMDLPQVRACNCLRALVSDAVVGPAMHPFSGELAALALRMMRAPLWPLRNVGLLLYGAVAARIIGNKKRGTVTCRELVAMHPSLLAVFEAQLGADAHLSPHPGVFPTLALLSRLPPDSGEGAARDDGSAAAAESVSDVDCRLRALRESVLGHTASPIAQVRHVAARAMTGLWAPSEFVSLCRALLVEAVLEPATSRNRAHGALLACAEILRCAEEDRRVEVAKSLAAVLLSEPSAWWTAHACLVTRAAAVNLLRECVAVCASSASSADDGTGRLREVVAMLRGSVFPAHPSTGDVTALIGWWEYAGAVVRLALFAAPLDGQDVEVVACDFLRRGCADVRRACLGVLAEGPAGVATTAVGRACVDIVVEAAGEKRPEDTNAALSAVLAQADWRESVAGNNNGDDDFWRAGVCALEEAAEGREGGSVAASWLAVLGRLVADAHALQSRFFNRASAWASFVAAFSSPSRPGTCRAAATASLRRAGLFVLRELSRTGDDAALALWDAVFALLQDEDDGVREGAAAFVSSCNGAMGSGAAESCLQHFALSLRTARDVCCGWLPAHVAAPYLLRRLSVGVGPLESVGGAEQTHEDDGAAQVIFEEEPANMFTEGIADAQQDARALRGLVERSSDVLMHDAALASRLQRAAASAASEIARFAASQDRPSTVRHAPTFASVYRRLCILWALRGLVDGDGAAGIRHACACLQQCARDMHPLVLAAAADVDGGTAGAFGVGFLLCDPPVLS